MAEKSKSSKKASHSKKDVKNDVTHDKKVHEKTSAKKHEDSKKVKTEDKASSKQEEKKVSEKITKEKFSFEKLTIIFAIIVLILAFIFLLVFFLNSPDNESSNNSIDGNLVNVDDTLNNENLKVDEQTGDLNKVLLTVDGEEVTNAQVLFAMQSAQQQGQTLSEAQALEQVIIEISLIQEATKGGFMPSLEEVEVLISEQLSAQGTSLEDYKIQMQGMGISYEDEIQVYIQQTGIQLFLENEIAQFDISVSKEEVEEFYNEYKLEIGEGVESLEILEAEIENYLLLQKQRSYVDQIIFKLLETKNIEYLN